jgi:hypothetical protein
MLPIDEKSGLAEESPVPVNGKRSRRVEMATIQDDDERLLAQIGYTQVGTPPYPHGSHSEERYLGSQPTLHKVVDNFLRCLCSWSSWLDASYVWCPVEPWRTGFGCLGLACRISYGFLHFCFW